MNHGSRSQRPKASRRLARLDSMAHPVAGAVFSPLASHALSVTTTATTTTPQHCAGSEEDGVVSHGSDKDDTLR